MNRSSIKIISALLTLTVWSSAVSPVFAASTITKKVYSDDGLYSGATVNVWSPGAGSFDGSYTGAVPNDADGAGIASDPKYCFKTATNGGGWAGWGVFKTEDMSSYSGGWLRFSVNSPANLKIEIQDGGSRTRYLNQYVWTANTWSEVTIPLSHFTGVNLANITALFLATIETNGTFYIDHVRWIKPGGEVTRIDVIPDTAYVSPGAKRTFTSVCYNASDVQVNPTVQPYWTLSNTSVGSLSLSQGMVNAFTSASNATNGQYTQLRAVTDGTTGYSDIYISTQAFAIAYYIYNDEGLPYGGDIKLWEEDSIYQVKESSDTASLVPSEGYVPESNKFLSQYVNSAWGGWGIFYSTATQGGIRDLSGYESGYLSFWVKTSQPLKVEMQESSGSGKKKSRRLSDYTGDYSWDGTQYWQEIRMPMTDFLGTTGIDASVVHSPFMITAESLTIPTTFYVDNVRLITDSVGAGPSKVQIIGKKMYVDDQVYVVKGVCAPVIPVGYDDGYDWSSSTLTYRKDISLLKAMGCNTLRLYKEPGNSNALLEYYNKGIRVIMTFNVDPADVTANPATVKADFISFVKRWMHHPATLAWCIGNEVNLSLSGANLKAWYELVDECAQAAHQEESLGGVIPHPVTTANAGLGQVGNATYSADDASMDNLDFWSLQVYNGSSFETLFTNFNAVTAKPMFLSEFGCDAWNGTSGIEDESTQNSYVTSQWGEIEDNLNTPSQVNGQCLGGSVFQWSDGWWKSSAGSDNTHDTATDWTNNKYSDPNMNEEWWGICALSSSSIKIREMRPVYFTLRDLWNAPPLIQATINGGANLTWSGQVKAGSDTWKVSDYPILLQADTGYADFLIQLYTDNMGSSASPRYTGETSTTSGKGFNLVGVSSSGYGLAMCWKITEAEGNPGVPVWKKDRGDGTEGFMDYQWKWMKDASQTNADGSQNFIPMEEYVRVWDQRGIYWADHAAIDTDPVTPGNQPSPATAATPNYIYVAVRLHDSMTQIYMTNSIILDFIFP